MGHLLVLCLVDLDGFFLHVQYKITDKFLLLQIYYTTDNNANLFFLVLNIIWKND